MIKKTDLPEIPGDRLQDFSSYFEHVLDGVMLSEHIAFIQTRQFGLEADLAIDDDYDDAEVFWSLRRAIELAQRSFNFGPDGMLI